MHLRVCSIILFLTPLAIHAQTWTSPNDVVAVTTPEPSVFTEVTPPPSPFLVLWESSDATERLGIMMMQIPPDIQLKQDAVEEGLGEQIGGQTTRMPSKNVSGHEIWMMRSDSPNATVFQAVFQHNNNAYKIMSITSAANKTHPPFDNTLNSLSLPAVSSPGLQQSIPPQDQDNGITIRDVSKKLGGMAILILIVVGIIKWQRQKDEKVTEDTFGDSPR